MTLSVPVTEGSLRGCRCYGLALAIATVSLLGCALTGGCSSGSRNLDNVEVPVYPGAQRVARSVSRTQPVLIVQYRAPVAYPSEAVPEFYEKELLARGWEATVSLPATQGDRTWGSLMNPEVMHPDLPKGQAAHDFQATWRNAKLDVTLTLNIVTTSGVRYQDVLINVRHPAQQLVTLGLRHLGKPAPRSAKQ